MVISGSRIYYGTIVTNSVYSTKINANSNKINLLNMSLNNCCETYIGEKVSWTNKPCWKTGHSHVENKIAKSYACSGISFVF